jgi:hypothetical protein
MGNKGKGMVDRSILEQSNCRIVCKETVEGSNEQHFGLIRFIVSNIVT